ncbi:CHC2 zinc finger domain-containing protein [Magnetospirillum molischianum]|uniref:Putative DNA primase n=1 Tax=Magnetospirillum molischianum DSM 120 TaxID=1150626 RepID=H8FUY0_MAGML|nr:CHC2 zinc finger domain-containing protein [Magnetospirillum molischianum]CCG42168.1 putative DNA primase [Magnetospirillum molischianum DSM 120]
MTRRSDRFSSDDRLAVRARHPIEVVVGRHAALRKRGRKFWACCPFHAEKTASFAVDPERGTWRCYAGCGGGDVVDFVMRIQHEAFPVAMRRLMDEAGLVADSEACRKAAAERQALEARLAAAERQRQAEQQAAARAIWERTIDPAGTLVEAYFASRGLTLPVRAFGAVLRFTPALKYWVEDDQIEGGYRLLGFFPAIVGLIQECRTRQPVGVHLTHLDPDTGAKLSAHDPVTGESLDARKIRGRRDGGAIMLRRPGLYLGIAEGWETALSVLQSSRLLPEGHPLHRLPVWAATSLGNLGGAPLPGSVGADHPDRPGKRLPSIVPDPKRPGVIPPPDVRHPILLEDGDSADLAAAEAEGSRALARWSALGMAPLRLRAQVGCDFNDLVMGGGNGPV